MYVCMYVCLLDDHGLTKVLSDVIYWMYTHMKQGSVIGYIILTFGLIKGH